MITGALIFVAGLVVGALPLIAICARALRDDAWDSSNVFNVLRVLGHLATHPSDFARMYYVEYSAAFATAIPTSRPFDYIGDDEYSDNFPTSRP